MLNLVLKNIDNTCLDISGYLTHGYFGIYNTLKQFQHEFQVERKKCFVAEEYFCRKECDEYKQDCSIFLSKLDSIKDVEHVRLSKNVFQYSTVKNYAMKMWLNYHFSKICPNIFCYSRVCAYYVHQYFTR